MHWYCFRALMVQLFIFHWLLVESSLAENLIVRPPPAPGALDNPLKGWCPYTDAGRIYQPYSMVFQYVSWRELEPQPDDFRFEDWETQWNVASAQGKHIVFRVYVDYPSKPSGLPDWLRTAGVKEIAYTEYGGGMSPDYNDPRMIAAMERLIEALGKRYNNHPRVAFVQLGLLGFWGEWHTYPKPELYASPNTEQRVIEAYRSAFREKSLMVRYAKGYASRQEWIGFHDDMFPQDTDNGKDWSFLAGLRTARRLENWRRAVIGGEMVPDKARKWLGDEYETTKTMLARSHFSWVGPYCPALEKPRDKEFTENSEVLVRQMGYEFQISQIEHPTTVKSEQSAVISLQGKNLGVAPFYYPWSVEWALLDSIGKVAKIHKTNWDIRQWKPGNFAEHAKVTFDLPPGKYRLGIGIRDPWKARPTIRFANDLPVVKGWAVLSQLEISP